MKRFSLSERVPLRGWWRRLGLGGQFCAGLGGVIVILAAGIIVGNGWMPEKDLAWPGAAVVLLVGVVWAVGLAVAAGLPVGGYLIAGLWLGWHGVAMMGPWTGTPVVALPVVWWLGMGLAVLAWRGPRRKEMAGLWWLAISLGAAYLVAGPAGWHRLPGKMGDLLWMGRMGLGFLVAGAGWWLLPKLRSWEWTEPGFGKVLGGSLAMMAVGLGVSFWRDPEASAGWAWGVVEASGFLASLGWFWLGGLFAAGVVAALETGSPWMGRITRMGPMRRLGGEGMRWILPGVWLTVTLVEWLATHEAAQQWASKWPAVLTNWIRNWPADGRLVAQAHAWVGVMVVVLGAGFIWQGHGKDSLRRLNAVWLGALLCIPAVAPAMPAGMVTGDARATPWAGPALLLIGGSIAAVILATRSWEHRETGHGCRALGVMVLLLGIVLAGAGGNLQPWAGAGGVAALLGMVHMALPLLLYRWWKGRYSGEETLLFSTQVWLSVLGMLGVLPLLHRNVSTVSQMAFCPLFWIAILLWLRMRRPELDTAAGTLAGGVLGSGTVAAWSRPDLLLPEVPLFSWLNPPAAAVHGLESAARPFINPGHFILVLVLSSAGALLGAFIFREKSTPELPLMPLLTDPTDVVAFPPEPI